MSKCKYCGKEIFWKLIFAGRGQRPKCEQYEDARFSVRHNCGGARKFWKEKHEQDAHIHSIAKEAEN